MLGVSNSDLEGSYLMGTEQYLMYWAGFGAVCTLWVYAS